VTYVTALPLASGAPASTATITTGSPGLTGPLQAMETFRMIAAYVECGACLPKCPKNVPIIAQLAETAPFLG